MKYEIVLYLLDIVWRFIKLCWPLLDAIICCITMRICIFLLPLLAWPQIFHLRILPTDQGSCQSLLHLHLWPFFFCLASYVHYQIQLVLEKDMKNVRFRLSLELYVYIFYLQLVSQKSCKKLLPLFFSASSTAPMKLLEDMWLESTDGSKA